MAYDRLMALLRTCPKHFTSCSRGAFMSTSIDTLLTIVRKLNQCGCLSTDRCTRKIWSMCTMGYNSTIKKDEIMRKGRGIMESCHLDVTWLLYQWLTATMVTCSKSAYDQTCKNPSMARTYNLYIPTLYCYTTSSGLLLGKSFFLEDVSPNGPTTMYLLQH